MYLRSPNLLSDLTINCVSLKIKYIPLSAPVAGLVRGHGGVRPQGIEAVNCLRRVAACVGGNFLWDLAGGTSPVLLTVSSIMLSA